jgi:hypothetical protein
MVIGWFCSASLVLQSKEGASAENLHPLERASMAALRRSSIQRRVTGVSSFQSTDVLTAIPHLDHLVYSAVERMGSLSSVLLW